MAEEDWTIVPKLNNKWQDEEDDDIKENWDDEDDEEASKASSVNSDSVQQQQQQQKEATIKKVQANKKKSKVLKEKIAQKELEMRPKTTEELIAEKLERQRLVEEGDLALAKDTFGVSEQGTEASIALNTIRLATQEDFDNFRKALDDKLTNFIRSPYYFTFLEDLVRSLASNLDTDNIRKLNTILTALYNEKIKQQKQQTKGKSKAPKKNAKIKMELDDDYTYNQYGDDYDDFA